MSVKFYICNHCKNIITKMNDSGVPVVCCGEKMTELIPGTSDGAHEKHVPAFEVNGNKVRAEFPDKADNKSVLFINTSRAFKPKDM